MTDSTSEKPDRRAALHRIAGLAAAPAGFPLLAGVLGSENVPLISSASAAAYDGVQPNQGGVVHIPGASVPTVTIAEWMDPKAVTGPFRIAQSKAALERAPATAARYEAKLYNFPSGSLRTMTFKKGGPVMHQITFETQIYVLSGTATLTPLPGHQGKPVKVSAGDALFLPSGYLSNPKTSEDFVILQAMVGRTVREAKSKIVTAKQAEVSEIAQWQADGKEFRVTKPEERRNAPKTANLQVLKRYVAEGNSIRVDTMKGGRSNTVTNNRVDVLMYIAKGHFRRKEGDQMLDLVAGDCIREKMGHTGHWEPQEESVFIATDAPMNLNMPPPDSVPLR